MPIRRRGLREVCGFCGTSWIVPRAWRSNVRPNDRKSNPSKNPDGNSDMAQMKKEIAELKAMVSKLAESMKKEKR